jgi:hypothetical protein
MAWRNCKHCCPDVKNSYNQPQSYLHVPRDLEKCTAMLHIYYWRYKCTVWKLNQKIFFSEFQLVSIIRTTTMTTTMIIIIIMGGMKAEDLNEIYILCHIQNLFHSEPFFRKLTNFWVSHEVSNICDWYGKRYETFSVDL